LDTSVARTSNDLTTVNTLVVVTFPIRFQIAPGTDSGLGIKDAPFTLTAGGVRIPTDSDKTDENGEVRIPLANLLVGGPVVVNVFDTDYTVALTPIKPIDQLDGQQQRLDTLGYMMGYQLDFPPKDPADDNLDGPRTQQAIMNFQSDQNLFLDGVIGAKTRDALKSAAGR
jgi:hypothetical protein